MIVGFWWRAEAQLALTFAGLILAGTLALRIPQCHSEHSRNTWLDDFFTATSAVCVTGLATVDPASEYTQAGHVVLLLLIQLGGLGIMTFAAAAAQVFGSRLSLGSQTAVRDSFLFQESRISLKRSVRRIFGMTLLIEALGAAAIYVGMQTIELPRSGWFEAVFIAISAFCNAGFSVYSDNAIALGRSTLCLYAIMLLVIAGGLGYAVLFEIYDRAKQRIQGVRRLPVRWTLHARLVLMVSGALVFGGALALALTGLTTSESSLAAIVNHALFQSVTSRTAGFNSIDITALPVATLLIITALMYIGGSPGSCAGGIKTTSLAVGAAAIAAGAQGRETIELLGRRLPIDVLRRTAFVIGLTTAWNLLGVFVLTLTEGVGRVEHMRLERVLFEQVSAFCTVGLSTGITPQLSDAGKLWLCASMFVGRLGALTIALAVLARPRRHFEYPEEAVMIG